MTIFALLTILFMSLFLDLSLAQWSMIALCAMLTGMSKVGVPGVSLLVIPVLALIFGGKLSTGLLLPILIMADFVAVTYYRRHTKWNHLARTLPWAFLGIMAAMWVGNIVNDQQFKNIIALVVFACLGMMLWKNNKNNYPEQLWFAALMGVFGGFASMIGNAAGPIFAIYLLALRLPKNNYIGTSAWLFCIVNLTKFPVHILVWKTISIKSLTIDVMVFPAVLLGAFLGIKLINIIPEKTFRTIVIVITALSAFLLLF